MRCWKSGCLVVDIILVWLLCTCVCHVKSCVHDVKVDSKKI